MPSAHAALTAYLIAHAGRELHLHFNQLAQFILTLIKQISQVNAIFQLIKFIQILQVLRLSVLRRRQNILPSCCGSRACAIQIKLLKITHFSGFSDTYYTYEMHYELLSFPFPSLKIRKILQ